MNISLGEVIGGHNYTVQPPAFSPDGTRVVAGDLAGGLFLRERQSAEAGARFVPVTQVQAPPLTASKQRGVLGVVWHPSGSLLASLEARGLLVRDSSDLSEAVVKAEYPGKGPMALGGDGCWVAVRGETSATILDFPALNPRRIQDFSRGGFEYFQVKALAADPHGPLLAVSDSGGQDETAMGAVLARGTPQVTLFDVAQNRVDAVIEQDHHVHQLAFDPWRQRIFTAIYHGMGIWLPNGEAVQRFHPYERVSIRSFTITERWVVTSAEFQLRPARVDLWDAVTFRHLATVMIPCGFPADWIVASPDGQTLLTPEYIAPDNFGIRVWSVQD